MSKFYLISNSSSSNWDHSSLWNNSRWHQSNYSR